MMIRHPSFPWRALLPFLLAVVAGCNGEALEGTPHSTDEQLIANFNAQRPAFEKLREMILHDSALIEVTQDSTVPVYHLDIGVSRERVAEYRRLLKVAGIAEGLSVTPDRERIELLSSAQSLLAHGSIKGYLYTDSILDDTVEAGSRLPSDAEPPSLARPSFETWTRRIDGNWYLFFERY